MMLPTLFLAAALLQAPSAPVATAPAPVPGALDPQSMPRRGCAAFLWSVADRKLVGMATAEAGTLRMALGAKPVDYPRVAQSGEGGFGFATQTRYASGDVTITLDMTVSTRAELTDGGLVQQGTLTIQRTGADTVLVPVGGLIGCAPAP